MATDTAFAIAVIAMMGHRIPVELRIFLTAAAIVDDIGAIAVVALFYSGALVPMYLLAAIGITAILFWMNKSRVRAVAPYAFLGIALWCCVHAGGLHATVAGVVLAMFIPARPPANLSVLTAQANSIMHAETIRRGETASRAPSEAALRSFNAIHDRLESPADRVLRNAGVRSSYLVLPLFAFANAGVSFQLGIMEGRWELASAITLGLLIGKPLGMLSAAALAVRLGLAKKSSAYSWTQLAGACVLAGIGFTMSLFIAGQALPNPDDLSVAKLAVFAASILAAVAGAAILWQANALGDRRLARQDCEGVRAQKPLPLELKQALMTSNVISPSQDDTCATTRQTTASPF